MPCILVQISHVTVYKNKATHTTLSSLLSLSLKPQLKYSRPSLRLSQSGAHLFNGATMFAGWPASSGYKDLTDNTLPLWRSVAHHVMLPPCTVNKAPCNLGVRPGSARVLKKEFLTLVLIYMGHVKHTNEPCHTKKNLDTILDQDISWHGTQWCIWVSLRCGIQMSNVLQRNTQIPTWFWNPRICHLIHVSCHEHQCVMWVALFYYHYCHAHEWIMPQGKME